MFHSFSGLFLFVVVNCELDCTDVRFNVVDVLAETVADVSS